MFMMSALLTHVENNYFVIKTRTINNVHKYTHILFLFIYFINYNAITSYILIIYELSNFDHLLGVVSQTRVSGGNRTHDPHTNSLAHYPLDYQGTHTDIIASTSVW